MSDDRPSIAVKIYTRDSAGQLTEHGIHKLFLEPDMTTSIDLFPCEGVRLYIEIPGDAG